MLKCKECGFESKRLQWTHFRYNCTGRFHNGTEYQLAYPGEKLVDESVSKSTAVTLENLIKKYGDLEGKKRWELYKEKQAYSNSFEYKKEKYGWSKEQFDYYNQSRSQTLEKMIKRYGESEGIAKWQNYCERQGYTNTRAYFIEKYGQEVGLKKYLQINKQKSVSNPQILAEKLGITVNDAVEIIISRQKNFFRSNLEQEFVTLIEMKVGRLDHTSNRNPYGRWSQELNSYVVYDIKHKNCIIEFNGDYWHANPKIYKDSTIIRGKTALEIRHRDMLKLKTVENLGFKTLTIWESDFLQDKNSIIKKVYQWILKELN